MQLTETDFDTPDNLLSQRGAQLEFLQSIKETAPQVLNDLAEEPFRIYCSLREEPVHYQRRLRGEDLSAEEHRQADAHVYITSAIWRDMSSGKAPDFDSLQQSLHAWSKRWNLDHHWCR